MQETLDKDISNNNQEIIMASKKAKICRLIVFISLLIVIITAVVLLVCHFKYGLFDSEIYQVAEIKREENSIEYFTETKTIKSKMTYANAESFDIEQEINTDFIIVLKDKKEIQNDSSEKIYINYGYLIILDAKEKALGEVADLDSFNIFDKEIVKQFEDNPDEPKYPIAQFAFYENGTLININLPNGTVTYNAEKMLDLIKDVIPKLTRNKTEDENNGIEIKTRDSNKKKSFSKYEPPKEFDDKYSKTKFKGSKITKLTETDIEDNKITQIRSNTNLYLQTQKNGDEEDNMFGIDNLGVVVDSKITSTKSEKGRLDVIELVDRLASKITFVDSEKVMNSLPEYKSVEQNIGKEKLRNLELTKSKKYQWALFEAKNTLGIETSAFYIIELSDGDVLNYIQFNVGIFTVEMGNKYGMSQSKTDKKPDRFEKNLGKFPLLGYYVDINVKLGISLSAGVTLKDYKKFLVTLSGSVYYTGELEAGVALKLTAGVTGEIIGAEFTCGYNISPLSFSRSDSKILFHTSTISGYLNGETIFGQRILNKMIVIWKGWDVRELALKYFS